MGGRYHFDKSGRQVEAAIGAALDHALELLGDLVWAEVSHLDVDATVRRRAPGPHLLIDAARYEIPRSPLGARVARLHEACTDTVDEMSTSTAEALDRK